MGVNKITLYPNQRIDYIWMVNGTASQTLIDSTYVAGYIPSWTDATLLLANYNDNSLDAGNILDIPVDITNWNIFRRNNNILQQVAKVDASITSLHDYVVANDTTYDYLIFPETDDLAGSPIASNVVTTRWWNWCLIELEDDDNDGVFTPKSLWLIDLDLSSSDFVQNMNRNVYQGFTTFPKVSYGQMNYLTGSINALIGNVNCTTQQYVDTIEMLTDFKRVINSPNRKILKDRKGGIYEVATSSNSFNVADRFEEQQTTINFGVVQVGDTTDLGVISLEETQSGNVLGGDDEFLLGGDSGLIEG